LYHAGIVFGVSQNWSRDAEFVQVPKVFEICKCCSEL